MVCVVSFNTVFWLFRFRVDADVLKPESGDLPQLRLGPPPKLLVGGSLSLRYGHFGSAFFRRSIRAPFSFSARFSSHTRLVPAARRRFELGHNFLPKFHVCPPPFRHRVRRDDVHFPFDWRNLSNFHVVLITRTVHTHVSIEQTVGKRVAPK